VPVIGVPKTIDNDLGATYVTFGFQTAVEGDEEEFIDVCIRAPKSWTGPPTDGKLATHSRRRLDGHDRSIDPAARVSPRSWSTGIDRGRYAGWIRARGSVLKGQ